MHGRINLTIYMIRTVVHLKLNLVIVIHENYEIEHKTSFQNYSSFNASLKLNYGCFKKEGKV